MNGNEFFLFSGFSLGRGSLLRQNGMVKNQNADEGGKKEFEKVGQLNLLKPGAEIKADIFSDVEIFLDERHGGIYADGAKR